MSELLKKGWAVLLAAVLLTGCGGTGDSDDTETPTGPVPASVELISDLLTLRSSGADTANLSAVVKDANNVVISGASVSFSVDNSASLSVTQPTTDSTGTAKATLGTPNNPENRALVVTATVAGTSISDTLTINVTGTQLILTAPSSMASGDTQSITVTLRDSDGSGIANQTVSLASALNNAFSNASPITNASGSATVNYTASAGGSETITATALNASVTASSQFSISSQSFAMVKLDGGGNPQTPPADITLGQNGTVRISWSNNGPVSDDVLVAISRGTVNAGTSSATIAVVNGTATFTVQSTNAGPAVVTATAQDGSGLTTSLNLEFVANTPASIAMSASPTSIGTGGKQSTINAVVRDANGNLVKNQTVIFSLTDITGGSISPSSAVTDSAGLASTVYTSSNTPSQTNGVQIQGSVSGTAVTGTTSLTVAQTPLFISFGTGNEIIEPDTTSYIKEFIVFITDANGVARPNQPFIASVVPLPNDGTANADPGVIDKAAYMKGTYSWNGNFWVANGTAFCRNEDTDLDGILDAGEDFNNSLNLTPGNQVALDGSSSFTTDSSGFAIIKLRYAQQYANWMQVRIRITATVSGTESVGDQKYVLQGSADDFSDEDTAPPGRIYPDAIGSPFGRSVTCADTN